MQIVQTGVQTFALLGTYVPRRCGIATFTKDLRDALVAEGERYQTQVVAVDDIPAGYAYPEEVRFQIRAGSIQDYGVAADLLNINQIDVAVIQHEFGIYGGRAGDHVLALMRNLRMPVITTLHTALTEPSPQQAAVMRELTLISDRLVVMCDRAVQILRDVYKTPRSKIAVIPHGIPDVPFVDSAFYKDQFGLEGRTILLTFGLLSPGKGLETAIEALPAIVERHPDVVYVILGAVHPHIFKREGNTYLASLQRLAQKRGVREHVAFHSRYVSLDELCRYLGAADMYLTPYTNKAQIVSGALAYAMGAGKAVISTPYWYAEEMLADGRGRIVPFDDPDALAEAAVALLDNPVQRDAMRKRAYMRCRNMVWKEVARQYILLANDILKERNRNPKPVFCFGAERTDITTLPDIDTSHLRRLTDDTGVLQHAIYAVPDRTHGYCTDDNSRALVAAVNYYDLTGDDSVLDLTNTYLSFLHHAFDADAKRFRNFLSYDRQWLDETLCEDAHGRSIWALGAVVAEAPNDAMLSFASRLFYSAVESVESLRSPRAWAFALIGMHTYLERFSGDAFVRRARATLANRLHEQYVRNASPEWPWCEDSLTYCNARLPHALILSGQWLPDQKMLEQGLRSLEWLVRLQVDESGQVSLIGNNGWLERSGARARFDQQPVDALALVEACAEAYRHTQDPVWRTRAERCFGWFLGNNDTQSVLYDYATGGCRDGLHANGPNLNEGAESTLAWLIALLDIHRLHQKADAPAPEETTAAGDEPTANAGKTSDGPARARPDA